MRPARAVFGWGLADEGQIEIYDELLQAIEAAAADIGISATRVRRPAEERAVDVLLLVGRLFRFRRLMAGDKTSHRVWWYGENLPIQAPSVGERRRSRLPRRLTLLGHRAAALAGRRRATLSPPGASEQSSIASSSTTCASLAARGPSG